MYADWYYDDMYADWYGDMYYDDMYADWYGDYEDYYDWPYTKGDCNYRADGGGDPWDLSDDQFVYWAYDNCMMDINESMDDAQRSRDYDSG